MRLGGDRDGKDLEGVERGGKHDQNILWGKNNNINK